jgi:hypothetical protein
LSLKHVQSGSTINVALFGTTVAGGDAINLHPPLKDQSGENQSSIWKKNKPPSLSHGFVLYTASSRYRRLDCLSSRICRHDELQSHWRGMRWPKRVSHLLSGSNQQSKFMFWFV